MMAIGSDPPYVGLRPFDVNDQGRFFGRAREIVALTRAIRSHTFTAVIGASGSGKSSLVRAGVLPPLARADWQYLITTPGTEPISRIARHLALLAAVGDDPLGEARRYQFSASLRASAFGLTDIVRTLVPDAEGLILVIDQFEELFRYGEEARGGAAAAMREESRAYVELLLTAAANGGDHLRIVTTMRSDYFGNCAAYAGLAEAVSRSQYLVPVPVRDQLEQAIREPLAQSGATIDDALVQRLLVDVEEENDRLPLLQHTLRRLWEGARGEPKHLSEKDYAAVGRLAGSIDVKGEAVVSQLANDHDHPEGAITLERVMKAITALDERGRATRRLSKRSELIDLIAAANQSRVPPAASSIDRVLGALYAEDISFVRLTPGDTDVEVDIGHEALIRSWKRLAGPNLDNATGWLREERQDGDRWRHLLDDALGDSQLMPWEWRRHRRWMAARHLNSVWARRYGGGWDRVQVWGRKWFRRVGGGMALGGAVASALLGTLAHDAWRQRAETAEQLRNVATITIGYARGISKENARFAALMALSILRKRPGVDAGVVAEAEALLADAMARPIETTRVRVGSPVSSAAFSPDGTRIVTASDDGAVRVWQADATSEPLVLTGHNGEVSSAAFSRDGTRIVTGSFDGTARVWRADGTGEPVLLGPVGSRVRSAAFSPDGMRIVTASDDGMARVWRADGMGEPVVLRGHESSVLTASFSPDGTRIVTGSFDGTARVRRADGTGDPVVFEMPVSEEPRSIPPLPQDKRSKELYVRHRFSVWSVAFSPDGKQVITGSTDNAVRVWSADGTGEPLLLKRHTGPVTSVAFSPGGAWIVTASTDGTARVWRAGKSGEPLVLNGHACGIRTAAFSPDGAWIVTGSSDGTARVWRAGKSGEPLVLIGHAEEMRSVEFSPDGTRIITASTDDTARVWRSDGTGEPVLRPDGGDVNSAEFSPDGTRIVMALDDHTVRVWSADGSGELLALKGHTGPVTSAAFSQDGARIVTASTDGTARVWRADGTGAPVVLTGHGDWVWTAAFSPDGTRVVTASTDGTARVWRADGTGDVLILRGHEGRVMSASFSPDGTRVVTSSDDNTARVWQADGTGDVLILRGHEDQVTSAIFSADGMRIVTGAWDGTMRVWDAATGVPIGPPQSVEGVGSISAVSLSPVDQRVVLGSSDGKVQVLEGGVALAPLSDNRLAAEKLSPLSRQERVALHIPVPKSPEEEEEEEEVLACGGIQ